MVEFGGWEMPVQYRGIIDEHRAVRARAGLFDVSHMGEIELRGPHALAACQRLTVNDVGRLRDGQAQYTLLLPAERRRRRRHHRVPPRRRRACCSASTPRTRDTDSHWMREHARRRGGGRPQRRVRAARAAGTARHRHPARVDARRCRRVPALRLLRGEVAGCRALVARTGYTGEDGWELYCAPRRRAAAVGRAARGRAAGRACVPSASARATRCGWKRAAALRPRVDGSTPRRCEAGLGWVVRSTRATFIGREALLRQQRARGVPRCLVGLD